MSLQARVLTDVRIPEEVEVEITDSVTGKTVVQAVSFPPCIHELGSLGAVNLESLPADTLMELAFAVAKHRAIDQYLRSLGVDPHQDLLRMEQPAE
jgi:hypothetical protein